MNKPKLEYRDEGRPRKVKKSSKRVVEIDSEPGDATHYRYLIMELSDGRYKVINPYTGMSYPDVLREWEVRQRNPHDIADFHDCNPWTAKEVMNAIKEVFLSEKEEDL